MSLDNIFSREYLKETMRCVRQHVSREDIKASSTYKGYDGTMEFWGPNGFYYYGKETNLWYFRARAWEKYLEQTLDISEVENGEML